MGEREAMLSTFLLVLSIDYIFKNQMFRQQC